MIMEKQHMNRIFLFVLLCLPAMVFSQNQADSLKQKHSESVTIYGTSRPVIRQAYKINMSPQLPVIKSQTSIAMRQFTDVLFPTAIHLQEIKPANISATISEKNWHNLLSLGMGSRISPYAEFFHSAGKKNAYLINFHLKHFSSFKNIKNYLPSPRSNSLAAFSYDKYFSYHVLEINAAYDLKTNRYYGFNTTLDTLQYNKNDSLLKQAYHKATLAFDYSSIYKNFDKIHHHITLAGTYFYDRYGTSELNARLDFDLHKSFQVTRLFNHQQLGLEGGYSYYKNQTKYQEQLNHFVRAMPYFDARYGVLSFKTGFNAEWLKLTGSTGAAFHFYPYLRFNVKIINNSLGAFGGLTGGMEKNSRVRLTEENPYLNSFENDYRWQNTKWRYYAGLRGNIAKRLDFEVMAQVRRFDNMVFYTYQSFLPWFYNFSNQAYYRPFKNEFSLAYYNGKVWDFTGSLRWSNSPVLNLWLKGDYHKYDLDFDRKPYYKPLLEVNLGISYLINKKIKPWAEIYYEGKRWAMMQSYGGIWPFNTSVWPDPNYKLDAYVDVNLGTNYQVNKQFSTFVKITNLLNKHYFRFNDYPVAGLEVMAGISYKF